MNVLAQQAAANFQQCSGALWLCAPARLKQRLRVYESVAKFVLF